MSARIIVSATAVIGIGLLGACSYGGEETGQAQAPVAVQRQAAVGDAAAATPKLVAADVTGLGQVVTDQNGLTLYRFDKDTAKPAKSNCDGDCATTWPPVLATGAVDVQGVDAKLVGSVARTDGTQQVTVNGWPVYRFNKDTAKGEAKGQGVGGTWAAVTPTGGKAVQAQAQQQEQQAAEAEAEAATAINTTNIAGLDTVLTDQNGMTIYLFTKDKSKPAPVSNCNGNCATTWPPLLAQGDVQINGIDPKLVGKVTRADGTEQITVGNWPVYRYSKDTAPGQANGHNVGGTWFAVETNGCKVSADKKPADTAASSDSGSAGGNDY